MQSRTFSVEAGKSSTIELTAEHVPENAEIELKDLPPGIQWHTLGRQGNQITLTIEASRQAPAGSYDISAQTRVAGRWASSDTIAISVQAPAPTWTTKN